MGPENLNCQSIKSGYLKKKKKKKTLLKNFRNNFICTPNLILSFSPVKVKKKENVTFIRSQKRKQISSLDKKIFFLSLNLRGL